MRDRQARLRRCRAAIPHEPAGEKVVRRGAAAESVVARVPSPAEFAAMGIRARRGDLHAPRTRNWRGHRADAAGGDLLGIGSLQHEAHRQGQERIIPWCADRRPEARPRDLLKFGRRTPAAPWPHSKATEIGPRSWGGLASAGPRRPPRSHRRIIYRSRARVRELATCSQDLVDRRPASGRCVIATGGIRGAEYAGDARGSQGPSLK